jgi:hypothetical protein
MVVKRRKPFVAEGTLPKISHAKQISISSVKTNYKHIIAEVDKVYPHGLSKVQKEHLKKMFLENPRVSPSQVLRDMGYLSGVGKGKEIPPKK